MRLLPPSDMAAMESVYRDFASNLRHAFKAVDVTAVFEPGGPLSPRIGIFTATGGDAKLNTSTLRLIITRALETGDPWIEHISGANDTHEETHALAALPLVYEKHVCAIFIVHLAHEDAHSRTVELSSQISLWSAYGTSLLQRHILEANLQTLQDTNRWITHELRSPLTGLIGFSTMLETDLYMGQSISQDDTKELIELVHTQGKQLQSTTNCLSEMRLQRIEEERLITVPITECIASIGRSWSDEVVSRSLAPLSTPQHGTEVTLDLPKVVSALERVLETMVERLGTPSTAPIQITAHMLQAVYWPRDSRYICIATTMLAGTDVQVSERSMHVFQLAIDRLRYLLMAHCGHLHFAQKGLAQELHLYLPIN